MKRNQAAEAILIREKRFGYFPRSFMWRGKTHIVLKCERCWTVLRSGLKGRQERLYFRVRCADGVGDVYQDVLANTWHIEGFVPDARPRLTARELAAGARVQ